MNQLINDDNKPILELTHENSGLPYQPPTLTLLKDFNIASGRSNVPENSTGLLES